MGASSPADSDITDEYAVYEAVGKIAAEMFAEYLKQDGQILRVSAILSVCGQDGLKNAVSAKKDPTFVNLLTKYIRLDRFHNLPSYAILSAQNVVNHMSVAYELGYKQAVDLSFALPAAKENTCRASLTAANDILK